MIQKECFKKLKSFVQKKTSSNKLEAKDLSNFFVTI